MKRFAALLLASLVLLSFISCVKQTGSDVPEEFYVNDLGSVYASAGMEQIFETGETVYYLCTEPGGECRLFFSDKDRKEWLPLCAKPDCLHSDEDCNSILEGNASNKAWLYGARIYYMIYSPQGRGIELWRMRLDGSAHEKLRTFLEERDGGGAAFSFDWYFHNKYAVVRYLQLGTESTGVKMEAYVLDLSTDELELKKIELPEGVTLGDPVAGEGNELYCICEDDAARIVKADLESLSVIELCELSFVPDLFSCELKDGHLYFAEGWDQGKIYRIDTVSGAEEVVASAEPQTRRWYHPYGEYVFGSNTGSVPSLKGTEISDLSGNLIQELTYSDSDPEIVICKILGDHVFGYEIGESAQVSEKPPTWYLDIGEIGSGDLAWRRWAPDGE